jgi:glutaredoxin
MTTATVPTAGITPYTAFVQPGCSSCLRMKEFLARHNVPFEVVDVMNDADGRARLAAFGVRHVPIVARGDEYAYGQDIADVARFVGIDLGGTKRLAPSVLIERWHLVLTAAQAAMRAMPAAILGERPAHNREGTVLGHGYHVFRIGEAFLDTVADREPDWHQNAMRAPGPDTNTVEAVAAYGDAVKARLAAWWITQSTGPDAACAGTVRTFQGDQSLHWFLERSTWHSAQHTRQLHDILARHGVAHDVAPLTTALQGLPVPERIWE